MDLENIWVLRGHSIICAGDFISRRARGLALRRTAPSSRLILAVPTQSLAAYTAHFLFMKCCPIGTRIAFYSLWLKGNLRPSYSMVAKFSSFWNRTYMIHFPRPRCRVRCVMRSRPWVYILLNSRHVPVPGRVHMFCEGALRHYNIVCIVEMNKWLGLPSFQYRLNLH